MSTLEEKRQDLTRWNRGGLERFQYIDGDAATWLEELRLAHLTQFLRGVANEPRTPEFWRDIFSLPETEWPTAADQQLLKAALSWEDQWQDFPDEPETIKKHNDRLLGRYHKAKSDQTFEISRAFARAAHVLLGYTHAYANEGYIRTATQWDNLKKMATMVGYFPAPAASATTIVGLTTKAEVRFETVPPGLGMKHSPSEGGAPVIFETLEELTVHEDLNALRARNWDKNPELKPLNLSSTWLAEGYKEDLSVGDIALILDQGNPAKPHPTFLSSVSVMEDTKGKPEIFELGFDPPANISPKAGDAKLMVEYPKPKRGLLQVAPSANEMVVKILNPGAYLPGNIVGVRQVDTNLITHGVIDKLVGDRVLLKGDNLPLNQKNIELTPLTEFAVTNDNNNLLPTSVQELKFIGTSGVVESNSGTPEKDNTSVPNQITGYRFNFSNHPVRKAFAPANGGDSIFSENKVIQDPGNFIEFDGAPPEGLISGTWLVGNPDDTKDLYALKVKSVRLEDKSYAVQFLNPSSLAIQNPDIILYYGPLVKTLNLENYTANEEQAVDLRNGTVLEIDELEAAALLKPKRKILVENQVSKKAVVASVIEVTKKIPGDPALITVVFEKDVALEAGFPKHQTVFRANALKASHGETKPRKTLGSGNGEKPTQTFHFDEPEITFVPDPTSETGVRPDIDVEVGGEIWAWVGTILEAEKKLKTYTTTIREDGTLDVRFLNRLPTGGDNIIAARYRVGTGPSGNNVPQFSFSKPLKSSAFVKEIFQPLIPSGGADREAVSAIRTNAPGHLKALGRAVSCSDFATLAARHSSVLKARWDNQIETGKGVNIVVTILPSNGGVAPKSLLADVKNFIQTRSVPGISVSVESFVPIPVPCAATLLVDRDAFDMDLVLEAADKALLDNFSILKRGLGQSLYLGDVLATLENVPGVEAVRNAELAADPGKKARAYFPENPPFRTINAEPFQILHFEKPGDIILKVEALK